jgi:hypothetical protein
MNFFDPIPNADFQIGITLALLCVMFIFLYAGVKIINRIEELRGEAKECDLHLIETCKRLEKATLYQAVDIAKIREKLNTPLYEVGNTIWFNKGLEGTPGVFADEKGVIIEISPASDGPWYNVETRTHIETIHQDLITAWTN